MAEEKTSSKSNDKKTDKTSAKVADSVTTKTGKKDFQQQVMQMWAASIVVALMLVLVVGIQTFFTQEESQIRRESYLANLEQLYQQELQECYGLSAGAEGDEAAQTESATQCLERVNQEGRYAELVRKWGGEDRLFKELPQ